jgi:hypothetical protein
MAHDVFISYSAKDQTTADAICGALEAQDIRCWIAHRDVPYGDSYPGAIVAAINASRILILVFSSSSNTSNDVMHEVERAFSNEIPIIPFRVENVQPSLDMQYFLSTPQWLNALTPPLEFHLEKLVDSVGALLKMPRKTKRRLVLSPIQLKVAVGAALALVIGALLFFNPFKQSSNRNRSSGVATPETVDFEKQYRDAVTMLSSANPQISLEGIRSLDKIAESGGEYWYWKAMEQLTSYVRQEAKWNGSADPPPKEMQTRIKAILEVIASRAPVYPANFTDSDKVKKRRELMNTDLRGLRLVGKAHLEYVDLECANLEGAVITGANLEGAMLKGANLKNANLGESCLEGVDLGGADINEANLRASSAVCGNTGGANAGATRGLNGNNVMGALNWECAGLSDTVQNQIREVLKGPIPSGKCELVLPKCTNVALF